MQNYCLPINKLESLIKKTQEKNLRFIGPIKEDVGVFLKEIASAKDLQFDFVTTKNSIKEFFFPRHEKLFSFDKGKEDVLVDVEQSSSKTVIFGAKPCDAASLDILNDIFTWDYDDQFYLNRRENSIVVTQACRQNDKTCFCTSVGLSTTTTLGSDVLMFIHGDEFYFEPVTEKGEAWLLEFIENKKEIPNQAKEEAENNNPEKQFDHEKIKPWLDGSFENKEFWQAMSSRCIGCGVCTYVCPTCHCFDIVDEGNECKGCRSKNWDSCSFGQFTMHTSGHNPRNVQYERWRQRINHKFKYYHDKFGKTLCTGCGRCVRQCPVSMGVLETLCEIGEK